MRTCVNCGNEMYEGYLHEVEGSTYCGDTCLSHVISAEEYAELYDAGMCFWTSWEEDDVC